jgi:hypothetical protein
MATHESPVDDTVRVRHAQRFVKGVRDNLLGWHDLDVNLTGDRRLLAEGLGAHGSSAFICTVS